MCEVITYPYPNFNGGFAKQPFKLEHEWAIIFYLYMSILFAINALETMLR